jgi:hypothetical protein
LSIQGRCERIKKSPKIPSYPSYETSATVEDHGQVRVVGVPFAPGTEVEVTISPKLSREDQLTRPQAEALAASRDRMRELFRTIKGFRNSPRIPREELYERGRLHRH